jgi:hypothetical protein
VDVIRARTLTISRNKSVLRRPEKGCITDIPGSVRPIAIGCRIDSDLNREGIDSYGQRPGDVQAPAKLIDQRNRRCPTSRRARTRYEYEGSANRAERAERARSSPSH